MNLIEFLIADGWLGFCWADILCAVIVIDLLALAGFLNERRSK